VWEKEEDGGVVTDSFSYLVPLARVLNRSLIVLGVQEEKVGAR
jgi:hypothetical protein